MRFLHNDPSLAEPIHGRVKDCSKFVIQNQTPCHRWHQTLGPGQALESELEPGPDSESAAPSPWALPLS